MTCTTLHSLSHLEIKLMNDEMADQLKQLKKENEQLQKMLEMAHKEATVTNKKLEAFAHFNSHKVRGTLTRIWGLANVIKYSGETSEAHHLAELLTQEAFRLDEVIREVSRRLFSLENG